MNLRQGKMVVVAGANGDLGQRIVRSLADEGAVVVALVRSYPNPDILQAWTRAGVKPVEVDYRDVDKLTEACRGALCAVSALAGLEETIMKAQGVLLEALLRAKVPRFIPSDFSLDFTKIDANSNRNLELRRTFAARVDAASIQATSILNGAFAEMLTGPAPIVLRRLRRILYWGDAASLLDFTAMDDVAAYTAQAALDPSTPRYLRISGSVRSSNDLAEDASRATGKRYRTWRAGGLGMLRGLTQVMRRVAPQPGELYPPWQGMQYLHNMYSGQGKLRPLDNNRYGPRQWESVESFLVKAFKEN
jgi:nucleoside-diphosphate-sugar epimerase